MTNLTLTVENMDDIKGVTLEERAKLVLLTLGRTPDSIHKAYRRLAKQHHPDAADKLVQAGIQGLLNFTCADLTVPNTVAVIETRMAIDLRELCCMVNMR